MPPPMTNLLLAAGLAAILLVAWLLLVRRQRRGGPGPDHHQPPVVRPSPITEVVTPRLEELHPFLMDVGGRPGSLTNKQSLAVRALGMGQGADLSRGAAATLLAAHDAAQGLSEHALGPGHPNHAEVSARLLEFLIRDQAYRHRLAGQAGFGPLKTAPPEEQLLEGAALEAEVRHMAQLYG